jgi:hypothetical protein
MMQSAKKNLSCTIRCEDSVKHSAGLGRLFRFTTLPPAFRCWFSSTLLYSKLAVERVFACPRVFSALPTIGPPFGAIVCVNRLEDTLHVQGMTIAASPWVCLHGLRQTTF